MESGTLNIIKFLCIFASLFIYQSGATVVTRLQAGVASNAIIYRRDQILYFKVMETAAPEGTLVQTVVSGCSGFVSVYGRACEPSIHDCSREEDFLPSPENYDFKYVIDPNFVTAQPPIMAAVCISNNGLCRSDLVYFYAIHPAVPQGRDIESFGVFVELFMRTFLPGEQLPLDFVNNQTLSFDLQNYNTLSWKKAMVCEKHNEKHECTQSKEFTGMRYKVFYTGIGHNYTANVGTPCGMTRFAIANSKEWITNDQKLEESLNFVQQDAKEIFVVNVLGQASASPSYASLSYRPLTIRERDPSTNGALIFLEVVVILFFIGLCVVLVGGVISIATFSILYMNKKSQTYTTLE